MFPWLWTPWSQRGCHMFPWLWTHHLLSVDATYFLGYGLTTFPVWVSCVPLAMDTMVPVWMPHVPLAVDSPWSWCECHVLPSLWSPWSWWVSHTHLAVDSMIPEWVSCAPLTVDTMVLGVGTVSGTASESIQCSLTQFPVAKMGSWGLSSGLLTLAAHSHRTF